MSMNEFNEKIKNKKVLVDFSAVWCGPCKMLGLVLEKVNLDIPLIKIDVDENSDIANQYKISVVPTLIIFENGKEIKRKTGFMTKEELESWVNNE